ncbi:MAG: lysylphosphatidylglycerol synthase transmembrane domain-containing protein [Acidobacteriota bacterium]
MNPAGARASDSPDSAGDASAPSGRGTPRSRRLLAIVLFALGVGALAALLAAVGLPAIASNLREIGWWFVLLVLIYGGAQLAFTYGWKILIGRRPGGPVSFGDAFAAYLAGDSINYFTTVGGEPLKAQILAGKIGYPKALATVAVHRHAEVASQGIFLALGIGITLTHFRVPPAARIGALSGLLMIVAITLWMTLALRRGAFAATLERLVRFRGLHGLRRFARAAEGLDERIGDFYERRQEHFLGSVAFSFLGWCGGLLETYVLLRLLAPGEGWRTAVAVEALTLALNNIMLFVPGRLGIAEGVRVGVFLLLGMNAAQGAAYSLARRGRELIWLLPGFIVLLKHHLLDLRHMHISELRLDEGAG